MHRAARNDLATHKYQPMDDIEYADLKDRAAATKRLAESLKAEFAIPSTSSAITVGVDQRGGLRLVLIAEGLSAQDARQLISAALAVGVTP